MLIKTTNTKRSYPDGHFRVSTEIPWSMGIKRGRWFLTSGQVDLDNKGRVRHPGDLTAQTTASLEGVNTILSELEVSPNDICKLVVYYVVGHDLNGMRAALKDYVTDFKRPPALVMVPTPYLTYDDMLVEIDAFGIVGSSGQKQPARGAIVPAGAYVFVGDHDFPQYGGGILSDLYHHIVNSLNESGSNLRPENFAQLTLNLPSGTSLSAAAVEEFMIMFPEGQAPLLRVLNTAEFECGTQARFHGFAATDPQEISRISLPNGVRTAAIGPLTWFQPAGPERVLGASDDISQQAKEQMDSLMEALSSFDQDRSDLIKLHTMYRGGIGPEDYLAGIEVRKNYFEPLGPCSTGVPIDAFFQLGRCIEIDAISMNID